MATMISRIIRKLGYQKIKGTTQINSEFNFDYKNETLASYSIVKDNTMLSYPKLASLFEKVIHCEKKNIPGDFVECGVWKGGAVGMMALANINHNAKHRKLHLFDAFDDICEPDPEVDGQQAMDDIEQLLGTKINQFQGKIKPISGIYDSRGGHGTIAECQELLINKIGYPISHIEFHKGWFQDTMEQHSKTIDKIAILRLDGDWYESTKICLKYLFEKVTPGGFIVIDDYGRYDGCKKAVDEYLNENKINSFLNYSDFRHGECRYIIK